MASWPAASRRQSSSSSRKSAELSGPGASYGHGRAASSPDAYGYGRQLSSYSTRSSQVSTSGSFSAAAKRVAGAFTSCFVPRRQVTTEEEEEEKKSRRSECHVSIDSGIGAVLFPLSPLRLFFSSSRFISIPWNPIMDEMKQTSLLKISTKQALNFRIMKSERVETWQISSAAGSWQEGRALTIADVSKATSNFSEKNMIRQGRSSTMYRGKLKDGSQIAVKCVRKVRNRRS
jgi:hypothetical protein